MRTVRRVAGGVLLLFFVWIGLVIGGWLPRTSDSQRAAHAALDAEPANVRGEHDAFAMLDLAGYDVPDAELDAVAKADVAAYAAWSSKPAPRDPFVPVAEGKYPKATQPPANAAGLCAPYAPDCLATVRADPAATRALLEQHAVALAHAEAISRYDHYRYAYEPGIESPSIRPSPFSLVTSAAALDFAEGRRDAAFERLCAAAGGWRRVRAHADALIVAMVGTANLGNAARLYAEMLAEQPADFAPPCADVFAPLADAELDTCAPARNEYRLWRNAFAGPMFGKGGAIADGQGRFEARVLSAVFNDRHALDVVAGQLGPYCEPVQRERVARRGVEPIVPDEVCDRTARVFDPLGCIVLEVAQPAYESQYRRMLDLDARLKLVATAAWLRAQPADGDRAAQFRGRPASLRSPPHDLSIDVATRKLKLVPLDRSKGETWEIPY